MKLIQIYECLCDETRLRILNLLSVTPLCVSHLQKVLQMPQVKISKHLTYMKERGMVEATRCENRMLYSLANVATAELESNMKCLQDCSKEYPIFKKDLAQLESILNEVTAIIEKIKSKYFKGTIMSGLRIVIFIGILSLFSLNLFADESPAAVLNAASENKHLFIFFYKDLNEKTLRLQNIFDRAIPKMGEQAKAIKVQFNEPSGQALIEKFDLKRSPMPFVVVLAPNGAITGGFPSFSELQLMDSISSPGTASCLKALQDRKLILLCLQNSQTANNEAALKGVDEFKADPRFADATEIVMIDPSNPKEHTFLKQLGVDTHSAQATTVLISPPAEVIGIYQGPVSKMQLVSDLQKAASGCCGPGGCCPGGKCGSR